MKVTIVIPNYNGKKFMEPCLKTLEEQTYKDFKILVVDNNSTDGSIEYMKEEYPDIELISLDENYGFSAAVNVGIKKSTTPYVILLNNDTKVDPHYVEEMVKAIEKSDKIFSVSSKMIQMYYPEYMDSAGDLYTVLGLGVCRGVGRPIEGYDKDKKIFTACAGAAIYRRSTFDEIGYFDESHFAYLEDMDIGYRARIYGYKNVFCSSAIVYHVGSGTSGSKFNTFKVKLSARNNVWLNYKNMPFLQLVINLIPLALGYLVKYLFFKNSGFGRDYCDGTREGFKRIKECRKVPFKIKNLLNYIIIEIELIVNTFIYVWDMLNRKKAYK